MKIYAHISCSVTIGVTINTSGGADLQCH